MRELFGCSYVDTYDRHGLLGPRSVLAHNVHPTDAELERLAAAAPRVAHCPTSNTALGSGLFPLRRHLAHGVRVALGTDVGAGTGFSLFKEGLQAYFMQPLLGGDGVPLTAAHLLYLATRPAPRRWGSADRSATSRRQAVRRGLAAPAAGQHRWTSGCAHAAGPEEALARAFALAVSSDVAGVWVDGVRINRTG